MSKKEFPNRGHCLSTNPIIVNYLKDNYEEYAGIECPKKAIGVAWNKNRWWYVFNKSCTPEYSLFDIIGIITKINEMKSFLTTGTLSTSSGIMLYNTDHVIATTTGPTYKTYDPFSNNKWVFEPNICTTTVTNLVTEPTKLRIKCRNLKKNLKVSLLQINLK